MNHVHPIFQDLLKGISGIKAPESTVFDTIDKAIRDSSTLFNGIIELRRKAYRDNDTESLNIIAATFAKYFEE